MAYGKTLLMKAIGRDNPVGPRTKTPRDRSLRGKDRIRARKAANKRAARKEWG